MSVTSWGAYNLVLRPNPAYQAINFASGKDSSGEGHVEYVADKFGARIEHRRFTPEVQRFPLTFPLATKSIASSSRNEIVRWHRSLYHSPRISPIPI